MNCRPEFPDGPPPLPEILSDQLRLQVFTHRSFFARPTHVFEDMPDDPSPDNEMLVHSDTVMSCTASPDLSMLACFSLGWSISATRSSVSSSLG